MNAIVLTTGIGLAKLHMIVAWAGILVGFLSGTLLGLKFHREDWLGGYSSHKRRLYRLGHISFFGLALINIAFSVTSSSLTPSPALAGAASIAFIIGTIAMPICCILVAHRVGLRMLFAIPVISLLAGSVCTFLQMIKL